uniref:Uncharacterized protein n=1 Tax=Anguilla anguilla TaxID=7936 RepID=A0A0E9THI0_ANGAN
MEQNLTSLALGMSPWMG